MSPRQTETPSGSTTRPAKSGVRYRALAYQRVSKEEAETGSHTFETQESRISERLTRMFGIGNFDIIWLKDDGISGGYGPEASGVEKRTRKTLLTLRQELRSGAYDVFIIYNTDRLARSPRWFFQMLEDDILPYAEFVSVTEDIDFTTPHGRAMAGVLAIVNGMTRERIIERNQDAVATRTGQGYFQGHVPYGWRWQPRAELPERGGRRRILPIPEQGEVLRQMREWYMAGWSLQKITKRLNELGVPIPSTYKPESIQGLTTAGRPPRGVWNFGTVWKSLISPLHAGLINSKRHGLLKGDHWEHRYWEPEDREAILVAREGRRKFARTNTGGLSDDRLLNGFPICARCGSRMSPTSHSGGKWRSYRCLNGKLTGKHTCPLVSVVEEDLDTAMVDLIRRVSQEPGMRSALTEEARRAAASQREQGFTERTLLDERLENLRAQSERLLSALGRGTITDEEFSSQNGRVREEMTRARSLLAQAQAAMTEAMHLEEEHSAQAALLEHLMDFDAVWGRLDLMERREIVRQLVELIIVDVDEAHCGPSKSGNVTTIVRVKLLLLPEQTLILEHHKRKRLEKPQMGMAGLSPRQLALLYHINAGCTLQEAAILMGVNLSTIRVFESQIRCRVRPQVGEANIQEIARLAHGFVRSREETLPLQGGVGHRARNRVQQEAALSDPRFATVPFYLSPKLMEVLPLFASGASAAEVCQITGLPSSTVTGRRTMILEVTGSKTIFEAAQKARKAGLL